MSKKFLSQINQNLNTLHKPAENQENQPNINNSVNDNVNNDINTNVSKPEPVKVQNTTRYNQSTETKKQVSFYLTTDKIEKLKDYCTQKKISFNGLMNDYINSLLD